MGMFLDWMISKGENMVIPDKNTLNLQTVHALQEAVDKLNEAYGYIQASEDPNEEFLLRLDGAIKQGQAVLEAHLKLLALGTGAL